MPKKTSTKAVLPSYLWQTFRYAALLAVIFLITSYYISSWLLELYVSFAPYLIIAVLIFTTVSCLYDRSRVNVAVTVATLILLFFASMPVYDWFFSGGDSSSNAEDQLEMATLNKLVVNDNLTEVNKRIQNYDVVAVNEITKKDYQELNKQWKYSIITDCQCDPGYGSETAVFSKKPIRKSETISAGENLGVLLRVSIQTTGRDSLTLYSVHPEAPIVPESMSARDQFLQKIVFPRVAVDDKQSILVGDFNLSPYSPSYQKISNSLNSYRNISHGEKLFKTWCLAEMPVFCAPIDHVFVTKDLMARYTKTVDLSGSDHDLLAFKIMIK